MDPLSQLTGGIGHIDLTTAQIGLRLAAAFILGVIVALTYRRVHKAFAYSYSMVVGIIMISMIVCTVLMVIDNSLARAFGLMGALAIIRFRMPIKDIKDIMFLFLAIGNGIACGAGHYKIATIGVLATVIVSILMYMTRFGGPQRSGQVLLKIFATRELLEKGSDFFDKILEKHCYSHSLVEMHMGRTRDCEVIYSVRLAEDENVQGLLNELSSSDAIEQVVILSAIHNMDVQ
ncbi:DUF4956 domain-containing protein [bacterium]|nr:DUF4956 domain-containing protein [bacterium]